MLKAATNEKVLQEEENHKNYKKRIYEEKNGKFNRETEEIGTEES